MSEDMGVRTMLDFAAEHGLHRHTVTDLVAIHDLPYQKLGRAKLLSPKTQREILRRLGIKPGRAVASAN
jgi:hypothetical protein